MQLTPTSSTGIATIHNTNFLVETFPNPVTDLFTVDKRAHLDMQLFSLDGKLSTHLANKQVEAGIFTETFSAQEFSKGVYLLQTNINGQAQTHMLMIN